MAEATVFWEKYHAQLDALEAEEAAADPPRRDSDDEISRKAKDWNFVLGGPSGGMSVEGMTAELGEFMAATTKVGQRVEEMTATASDPRGLVEVTVNASGIVQHTSVADTATRVSPEALAAAFTEAAQEAAAQIHESVNDAWSPLLGGMNQLDAAVPIDEVSPEAKEYLAEMQRRADAQFPKPRQSDVD